MRVRQSNTVVSHNHASKAALFVDLANFDDSVSKATMSSHRLLSSDLVRTKQFDSSSKQMNPSLLRGLACSPSTYQRIDRDEYCAPCDRVARFYTISAAGLTLKQAGKVAKLMNGNQKASKKIIGFALAATAPDAFRATQRIAEIAETGKVPHKLKKQHVIIQIPSENSPLAQREGHRMLRSEPMYNTIRPTPLTQTDSPFRCDFDENGMDVSRDFSSWNPESVEESINLRGRDDDTHVSPVVKLDLKGKATERFAMAVDVIVRTGVITAGGSGNRAPIPSMNHATLNSIITRIPSITGFLDEHYMQHLLAQELSYVQDAYFHAAARACVEYDIKDPAEALLIGVDTAVLYDESVNELWTNKEYQVRLTSLFLIL